MREMVCKICGSREFTKLSDKVRFGIDKKIYRCSGCGIVFLHPQMTKDEEDIYYRDEYRKQFAYGSSVEEHFRNAMPEALLRRDRIKSFLKKEDILLEIGCASGYFLDAIKPFVKEAAGVEPHDEYRRYANSLGFTVFSGHSKCRPDSYDVICMFMTLEHFRDPAAGLREIGALLKNGGTLIVEVPNVDDIMISVFDIEAFKNYYWQAPHSWYFSPKTLSMVLDKAGFDTTLIPVQRYDLSNNISWMLSGKPGGQGKYLETLGEGLTETYAARLKEKFICDTIVSVSRKK